MVTERSLTIALCHHHERGPEARVPDPRGPVVPMVRHAPRRHRGPVPTGRRPRTTPRARARSIRPLTRIRARRCLRTASTGLRLRQRRRGLRLGLRLRRRLRRGLRHRRPPRRSHGRGRRLAPRPGRRRPLRLVLPRCLRLPRHRLLRLRCRGSRVRRTQRRRPTRSPSPTRSRITRARPGRARRRPLIRLNRRASAPEAVPVHRTGAARGARRSRRVRPRIPASLRPPPRRRPE
jgi:hypothetical protein